MTDSNNHRIQVFGGGDLPHFKFIKIIRQFSGFFETGGEPAAAPYVLPNQYRQQYLKKKKKVFEPLAATVIMLRLYI